jgi:hypothetical protein
LGLAGLTFIICLIALKLFIRRRVVDKEQDYLHAKGE